MLKFIGFLIVLLSVAIAIYFYQQNRKDKQLIFQLTQKKALLNHNLQTPLLSIRAAVSGIKEHWPTLLSCYEKTVILSQSPNKKTIPPQQFSALKSALEHAELSVFEALKCLKSNPPLGEPRDS